MKGTVASCGAHLGDVLLLLVATKWIQQRVSNGWGQNWGHRILIWSCHAFLWKSCCFDLWCEERVHIVTAFMTAEWTLSSVSSQLALMVELQVEPPPQPLSGLYCLVQTTRGLITGGGGSLCPCSIKGEGGLTRYQHEGTNGNSPLIHRLNQSQANMGASSRVKAVSAQYADQIKWGAHSRGSTWSIWSSTLPTSRSLMPPTCSTFCLTTALHAHFKLSLYRNDCHYRKVCTRVVHGMWPTPRLLLSPPASSAVYCIFIQNTARPSSRENRYICLLPVINKTQ